LKPPRKWAKTIVEEIVDKWLDEPMKFAAEFGYRIWVIRKWRLLA